MTLSYVPWLIHTCDTEPCRIRARTASTHELERELRLHMNWSRNCVYTWIRAGTASTHEAFKSGAWLVYTFDTGPCGIRAGTASTHEPTYCRQRHHQSVTHSRQTFCLTQSWGSFSSLTHLFTLSHIVTHANVIHSLLHTKLRSLPIIDSFFHIVTHRSHTNRNAFSSNILPHVKLRSLLICYPSFHVFTYCHPHILVQPTASRKAHVASYLLPILSRLHILSPTHSNQADCLT